MRKYVVKIHGPTSLQPCNASQRKMIFRNNYAARSDKHTSRARFGDGTERDLHLFSTLD